MKTFYNSENKQASSWVREPTKGLKGVDAPQFSSGLAIERNKAGLPLGAAFGLVLGGNNVMEAATNTYLLSGNLGGGKHLTAQPALPGESFKRAIALFAARKLITGNWINDKDEYLRPAD